MQPVVACSWFAYGLVEAPIQKIQAIRPEMPVIVCTGFSSGSTMGRIEDLGVHAVILKPALAEMLGTTVHEALGHRSEFP